MAARKAKANKVSAGNTSVPVSTITSEDILKMSRAERIRLNLPQSALDQLSDEAVYRLPLSCAEKLSPDRSRDYMKYLNARILEESNKWKQTFKQELFKGLGPSAKEIAFAPVDDEWRQAIRQSLIRPVSRSDRPLITRTGQPQPPVIPQVAPAQLSEMRLKCRERMKELMHVKPDERLAILRSEFPDLQLDRKAMDKLRRTETNARNNARKRSEKLS